MPYIANTTGLAALNEQDTTAFEQLAYFALRSTPMLEMVADVRSTNQSHPGTSVQFTFYDDLARQTSALTELDEVSAVALADSTVNVALAEYGNAVVTSAKLRGTAFLNVDADAANIVGYNMADSIDAIVHDVIVGSADANQVHYAGNATSLTTIDAADNLDAGDIREVVAQLRRDSVMTFGGHYVGMIHPDVSFDLRSDTAVTDIIQYQIRQDGGAVRQGSIGMFGGVDFIETPRLGIGIDATAGTWSNASDGAGSAGTVDVYPTMICGKQALAKAFSRAPGFGENPGIVQGPVTDILRRFQPIGWYHLVGYGRFREKAMVRIESSSSIGANT
jgi:N4-gp56 family major capsid protein